MTETACTYAQSKQLYLFNIITLAEDKLQSNFNRILHRLNSHQKSIQSNKKYVEMLQQKINAFTKRFEQRYELEEQRSNSYMNSKHIQINKLTNNLADLFEKVESHHKNLNQLTKMQEGLRLFIDQDCEARNMIIQGMKQKIRNMEHEISIVGNTLHLKQNVSQVLLLRNQINELDQQMEKVENEQKFVQFKLDKFEINNQKNEKNLMNKEIMLMKDLQEKIKTQIKSSAIHGQTHKKTQIQNQTNRSPLSNIQNTQNQVEQQTVSIINNYNFTQDSSAERPATRGQFQKIEYQKGGSFSFNQPDQFNQTFTLSKISDSLQRYDRKFEQLEKQIKQFFELSIQQQKKKKNGSDIEEKINAVKPEFLKVWSKFDALDDKISFMEKRLQQKNKQISQIMEVLKETQSSKFDQKLKMLQGEMFANLKDVRTKLQSKANNTDYEKFIKSTLQRMQNMSEQIILKSDKLEVKKALLFLESKIKEIILVISEEEQNQKEALLTKKQIKCISCDKEIQKFLGTTSGCKGNWDNFPFKEHSTDVLGKFGMTSFGSLARKLKRLDNKDAVVVGNRKNKESSHSEAG